MFLHNFRQFSENWIFKGISTGISTGGPYKNGENLYYLICAKKNFLAKLFVPLIKGKFLHNFTRFLVKICIILICAKKIFFGKIIYSNSSKEVFLHNFISIFAKKIFFGKIIFQRKENWIFEGISTGADLTKMVKICIISICAKKIFFGKKYFLQNYLKEFHGLYIKLWSVSKEEFLHNFRQFSENWIFEGISTGADLIKMVKICIISIGAKKIFFDKIICSTHQRKFLSTILHDFWKIEFLKEYRQARTLQKWWNLYYLNLC